MKISNIHITDVESFTQCRRKWNWESPLRCGLQRAMLPPALYLGQGVHIGLDTYYSSDCDIRAAIDAFAGWADERVASLVKFSGPLWEQEKSNIEEMRTLGQSMLFHYHLWSMDFRKNYDVIATERKFKTFMPRPELQRFESHTARLSGRLDGIAREKSTGRLYVLEFKTARSIDDNWMLKGLQGTAYVWAARKIFGRVDGILYHILRKKAPAKPKPLQSGGFSQAVSQDTSFAYFKHCLDRIADMELDVEYADYMSSTGENAVENFYTLPDGTDVGFDDALKYRQRQMYRDNMKILSHLDAQGNQFFKQVIIPFNEHKTQNMLYALYYTAMQMVDRNTPVFAVGSYWCNGCAFKDPCRLMDHGLDFQALLDAEYARRDYWEDTYGE